MSYKTELASNNTDLEAVLATVNNLPEAISIDTTLSVAGKAADAKAVGDAIAAISTTLPSGGGTTIIMSETEPGNLKEGDFWYMIMTELNPPREILPKYTVTLPSGEGYTVSGGDTTVYRGDSYSFTITIADGYRAGSGFAVKANGVVLSAVNDVYTITNIMADQTVTVEGVESNTIVVNIQGTGNSTYCYVTINGTKYSTAQNNWIAVEYGSTITFGVYGRSTTYPGWVNIDGSEVLLVTNQRTSTYNWTVPAGTKTITKNDYFHKVFGRERKRVKTLFKFNTSIL